MDTENQEKSSHELGHGKGTLQLTLNGKTYDWHKQYISGEELKKLGGIHLEKPLFLIIESPWENELIKNDTQIDLARPGIESFICKEKESHKVILTIQTSKGTWSHVSFVGSLLVIELIQKICKKFNFVENGNYELKIKGTNEFLEGNRSLESYHFDDCTVLVFTDRGTGA